MRIGGVLGVLLLVTDAGPGASHLEASDAQFLEVALALLAQEQSAAVALHHRVAVGDVGQTSVLARRQQHAVFERTRVAFDAVDAVAVHKICRNSNTNSLR